METGCERTQIEFLRTGKAAAFDGGRSHQMAVVAAAPGDRAQGLRKRFEQRFVDKRDSHAEVDHAQHVSCLLRHLR